MTHKEFKSLEPGDIVKYMLSGTFGNSFTKDEEYEFTSFNEYFPQSVRVLDNNGNENGSPYEDWKLASGGSLVSDMYKRLGMEVDDGT